MASTVWKGQLTFGLVSVPVRLYRAARKERVRMHYVAPVRTQMDADDAEPDDAGPEESQPVPEQVKPISKSPRHAPEPIEEPDHTSVARVSQSLRTEDDDTAVPRSELLRAHEVAPGQYVTVTQQEMRALRPQTSTEMQIVRSVRLEEIDPVYFETSYYVVPDKGGERAYSLLFAALKETSYVALATVAMHGREHVVVIRPSEKGLLAHTMFYEDEVRAENQFEAATSQIVPRELQLAKTFIEAIAAPFAPDEFKDKHREKLEALIASRKPVRAAASAAGETKTAARAPAIDIMEALKKSLDLARREPGRATEAKPPKARKRRA